MKPVGHPSNTRTLGAPAGWDQNGLPVQPLGITDQVMEGVPCVCSFWEPSAEERAAIAAGSKVILSIVGRNMPPALLMTEQAADPLTSLPASTRSNLANPGMATVLFAILVKRLGGVANITQDDINAIAFHRLEEIGKPGESVEFRLIERGLSS